MSLFGSVGSAIKGAVSNPVGGLMLAPVTGGASMIPSLMGGGGGGGGFSPWDAAQARRQQSTFMPSYTPAPAGTRTAASTSLGPPPVQYAANPLAARPFGLG